MVPMESPQSVPAIRPAAVSHGRLGTGRAHCPPLSAGAVEDRHRAPGDPDPLLAGSGGGGILLERSRRADPTVVHRMESNHRLFNLLHRLCRSRALARSAPWIELDRVASPSPHP